jgi:hypothetical protein
MKLVIKISFFLLIAAISFKEISGMDLKTHERALSALENPQQYYHHDLYGSAYSCPVCGEAGMRTPTQFYVEISRHLPVDCSCPISGCSNHTVNQATFSSLFEHIAHEHSGGDIPSHRVERWVQEAYKAGLAKKIAQMKAEREQGD